jgi:hypothetical protein
VQQFAPDPIRFAEDDSVMAAVLVKAVCHGRTRVLADLFAAGFLAVIVDHDEAMAHAGGEVWAGIHRCSE